MPSNIEIKARYPDLDRARAVCQRINARFEGILNQTDTYFRAAHGRLKLRQINSERAELIQYDRPNLASVRTSTYTVTPVADVQAKLDTLGRELGIACVVKKRRELFLWHNVRIHLDQVEGLGSFIEFEGVVSAADDETVSRQRVNALVADFEIAPSDRIRFSYSDLLAGGQ